MKTLFKLLTEANEKAKVLAVASLKRADDQTDEDFEKYKNDFSDLFKLQVIINGSDGEFIMSTSMDVLIALISRRC